MVTVPNFGRYHRGVFREYGSFERVSRMKKLLVPALLLNAALLAGRFWQELPANAAGAQAQAAGSGDVNGSGVIDLSDAIYLLDWLFTGGPAPAACAQESGLTPEEVRLLTDVLPHLSVVPLDDGQGGSNPTIRFSGVNVQVVNGLGATNGNPADPGSLAKISVNGLGNLIVGYQERCPATEGIPRDVRTGSHN